MTSEDSLTEEEKENLLEAAIVYKTTWMSPAAVLLRAVQAEKRFLEWESKAVSPILPEVAKVLSSYRRLPPGDLLPTDGEVEQASRSKIAAIADLVASNEKGLGTGGVDILASPGFQQQLHSLARWVSLGVLDPFEIVNEFVRAFGWKRGRGRPRDTLQARRDANRYYGYLFLRQTVEGAEYHTLSALTNEAEILKSLEQQSVPEEIRQRVAREIAAYRMEGGQNRKRHGARGPRLTLAQRCALWFLEGVEGIEVSSRDLERANSLVERYRKAANPVRRSSRK